MKRKTKSIIAFLMTVVLLFGMLPAMPVKADPENVASVVYSYLVDDNEYSLDPVGFTSIKDALEAASDPDFRNTVPSGNEAGFTYLTSKVVLDKDAETSVFGGTINIENGIILDTNGKTLVINGEIKGADDFVDIYITNSGLERGRFITNPGADIKTPIKLEGTVDLEVSYGKIKEVQSFGSDCSITMTGGVIESLAIDGGFVSVTGGTVSSCEIFNYAAISELNVKGKAHVSELLIFADSGVKELCYDGTEINDYGYSEIEISEKAVIDQMQFQPVNYNPKADPDRYEATVTITGGKFGFDPAYAAVTAGFSNEKKEAFDEVISYNVDPAMKKDTFWVVNGTASVVDDYRITPNEADEASVDFTYWDSEMDELVYKTAYFTTVEEAFKATEVLDYKDQIYDFEDYYHPMVTLLSNAEIDSVIDVSRNDTGITFLKMNGKNLSITDEGGITGTLNLVIEDTASLTSGTFSSSGELSISEISVLKGCDVTIASGTVECPLIISSGIVNFSGGEFLDRVEIKNTYPDRDTNATISGAAKLRLLDYDVSKNVGSEISLNLTGGYYTVNPETFKTYTYGSGQVKDQADYVSYDETKVEEYNGQADWEADFETYTWRIKREVTASSFSTVPAAVAGLKENGSALALVTAGVATGGTVKYVLGKDATTAPTTGWSKNIPTATAAGTYYVWYKIDPDENHLATKPACITVTVAAKENNNQNNDPNNDPNNNQNNNDENNESNNESNNENNNNNEEQNKPAPPPVDNSEDSPFSPVPEITATTESLYLVKGQTFSLNEADWTSSNKKVVSVSKKTGAVKAIKATGNTPVELTRGTDATKKTLKIYVADPKVKTKKLSVDAGKTVNAEITTDFKDKLPVYWYSSATDIATVDQTGKISGITKGKADITAQINGKAFTFKVTVTEETVVAERTLHITKGASMTVKKLGKVKITALSSTSSNVLVEKKKITAKECGTAIAEATGADGKTYRLNLIIEDPTITNLTAGKTNKYSVELTAGKSHEALKFKAFDREVVFKSNKPKVAYINEKGEIIALSKGKAKLTGKINGKTITINVKVNAQ